MDSTVKKPHYKRYGTIAALLALSLTAILFQNCGEGFTANSYLTQASSGDPNDPNNPPLNEAPPTISFATSAQAIQGQNVAITYTLSKPSPVPIVINVQVVPGTAVAGEDYEAPSATFTIPANQVTGEFILGGKSFTAKTEAVNLQLQFSSADAVIEPTQNQTTVQLSVPVLPNVFRDIVLPAKAIDIFAGLYHFCGILVDGQIYCWGYSMESQLGEGVDAPTSGAPLQPISFGQVPGALYGGSGQYHTCVLNNLGDVYCFGSSAFAFGNVANELIAQPTRVDLPMKAIHLAVGGYGACAVLENNSLYCWGQGAGNAFIPPTLMAGVSAKKVFMTATVGRACYIDLQDSPRCGTNYNFEQAQVVNNLTNVVDIKFVYTGMACAKNAVGAWSCWQPNTLEALPLPAAGAVDLYGSSFTSSACATSADNKVLCWGANNRAQLGTGEASETPIATPVESLYSTGVLEYAASNYMGCFNTVSGVKCSGY